MASVEKLKERTWVPEISPDYLDPSSDPPLSNQPSHLEVLVRNWGAVGTVCYQISRRSVSDERVAKCEDFNMDRWTWGWSRGVGGLQGAGRGLLLCGCRVLGGFKQAVRCYQALPPFLPLHKIQWNGFSSLDDDVACCWHGMKVHSSESFSCCLYLQMCSKVSIHEGQ